MDLLEMNMKNRSCRGYDESYKVSKETLEELVNLTRFAPASVNIQPMKYYLSWTDEQNAVIQPLTGWARQLPGNNLPYPGHRPTAFIVILHDKNVAPNVARFSKDVGIAAQTIALGAVEKRLNVCMIGNFSPEKVAQALSLPETATAQSNSFSAYCERRAITSDDFPPADTERAKHGCSGTEYFTRYFCTSAGPHSPSKMRFKNSFLGRLTARVAAFSIMSVKR